MLLILLLESYMKSNEMKAPTRPVECLTKEMFTPLNAKPD